MKSVDSGSAQVMENEKKLEKPKVKSSEPR